MTNMDKMRQFIEKFVESDSVKKEVGEVKNFKEWLKTFDLKKSLKMRSMNLWNSLAQLRKDPK